MLIETGDTTRAENRGHRSSEIRVRESPANALEIWSFFHSQGWYTRLLAAHPPGAVTLSRFHFLKGYLPVLGPAPHRGCHAAAPSCMAVLEAKDTGQLSLPPGSQYLSSKPCSLTTHDLLGIVGLHVAIIWGWWMGLGIKEVSTRCRLLTEKGKRSRTQGM